MYQGAVEKFWLNGLGSEDFLPTDGIDSGNETFIVSYVKTDNWATCQLKNVVHIVTGQLKYPTQWNWSTKMSKWPSAGQVAFDWSADW